MTEREKMLSGELYDPTDKELEQLRVNARKLARKYNSTEEDDQEEQAQILRKLLPAASFAESYYRWHEWKPPNLQRDFGILRSLVGN